MTGPSQLSPGTRTFFLRAGAISLLAWALLQVLAPSQTVLWTPAMGQASARMETALAVISESCARGGIEVDPVLDPNKTCLIGPEQSGLFTSMGQVEAKRSTLTPDGAGLLVHLLEEAGVAEGDTVAVGASGSFPGFLVATVLAIEALGAVPRTILSLGASSFGATRPEFNLLDLYELLKAEGLFSEAPVAVSLGGSKDMGQEFPPELRDRLMAEIRARGLSLVLEDDLRANVSRRMRAYLGRGEMGPTPSGPPAAFVNIGGNQANLGVSAKVLEVPPGLIRDLPAQVDLPHRDSRGVLFEMADMGVPIIHLLHVRGLALRYGLPWDPLPLPPAGTTRFKETSERKGAGFWVLTILYFCTLALLAFRTSRRSPFLPEVFPLPWMR